MFSFISIKLFHQGIVASGIFARLFKVAGMLREPASEFSERPYMISRPPGRSSR